MKKYLQNKEGMALPTVLIVMMILMIMASSLALFAYDSLLSVRWMSNEKKAYYLSRAGIEAASYTYQVANSSSTAFNKDTDVNSLDEISKVVAAAKSGAPVPNGTQYSAPVKSNTIYAYYTTDEGEGHRFSGVKFETSGNLNDPYCLGSFVVEIGKGIDLRQYKEAEADSYDLSTMDVVAFRCTASCGNDDNKRSRTTYAYIPIIQTGKNLRLYDDNGILDSNEFTKLPQTIVDISTGQVTYPTDDDRFIIGTINNINNFMKGLFKQFLIKVIDEVTISTRVIQPYSYANSGNIILDNPYKSKTIKAPTTADDSVVDHLYTIQTAENLFVKAGIDASAEKTGFTAIGLYGDQIVIDGDITMEVYITNPDAILANNLITTAMAQSRFRIGTVILGNATDSGNQKDNTGGIKYVKDNKTVVPDGVNKVFFNGNVNLKIHTQGAATQTFRVFNSGDVAYFYGSYISVRSGKTIEEVDKEGNVITTTETDDKGSKGIDLIKFFIDASLANLDGFKQNEATKRKLKQIKKLYYDDGDGEYEPYVSDDGSTVLMRKIIVEEDSGGYKIDNGKTSVKEIIQPSEGAGAKITWGRPRHGDVWNNFEKVS